MQERLQTRSANCDRQLSIAQGQERAFKATLRTAENSARGLREEMLRLKTMLQQVRTQCANDIRKRDVQIQRLKSHLTTQQRGTRPPLASSTITITPSNHKSTHALARDDAAIPLDSPNYDLAQETTEFLTQLSQNLSDENDNLIGLVRSTLTTLRALQGLSHSPGQQPPGAGGDVDGRETGDEPSGSSHPSSNLLQTLPTSYDSLATDMDDVLEHLRTLLTNPSFVPLEEVEVREDEINRLREGWEKMESRWREAVQMMDGWRKRMASGGKAVNLDELRMGLRLSPVKMGKDCVALEEAGSEDSEVHEDATGEVPDEDGDGLFSTKVFDEEDSDEVLGVGLQPDGGVLSEVHNLRNNVFAAIPEENTRDLAADDGMEEAAPPDRSDSKDTREQAASDKARARAIESKIPRQVSLHGMLSMSSVGSTLTTTKTHKRGLSSESNTTSKKPKLTSKMIEQKLDAARTEADRTEKRKLGPSAVRRKSQVPGKGPDGISKLTGRKARRRSTLTKDELECLIGARGRDGN